MEAGAEVPSSPLPAAVGLGESNNVILAAQARHALALSRLIADDGSWIEAQELERLILKSSDAISHCVLVGTCADRARLARRPSQSCMTQLFACSRGGHPSYA